MILVGYFFVASIVFSIWFTSFWNDAGTPKNDLISGIAKAIGPLLWSVVLPLSLLQISSRQPAVQGSKFD